jgi:hypothetical protein
MLSFILQDSIMDIKSIRVSNYQKEKDDRVGKGIFIWGAAGGVLFSIGKDMEREMANIRGIV